MDILQTLSNLFNSSVNIAETGPSAAAPIVASKENAINLAEQICRHYEGQVLVAAPCPAGKMTVGYGHTGPDVYEGQVITPQRADDLLDIDLGHAAQAVDSLVGTAITISERASLISFCFNLGSGALQGSTLLGCIKHGDMVTAAHEFLRWDHAHVNGVLTVLAGLTKRRKTESTLFATGKLVLYP